jgi:PAS domain S-box-containing protein
MARLNPPPSNFADVLTISEAADFLGVSTATLRNWDRSGKLKPRRHPQNDYRIYLHEDLEAVLRSADLSMLADESFAPQVDWSKMSDSEHFVQFYENDEFLIESASGFIGAALRSGGSSVVAVTPEHCSALNRKLVACGIDIAEAEANGRYVVFDAREALSRFMVGRTIDARRFDEFVGGAIGRMLKDNRRLHAFGEMVALLWADGNREAAIELERAWNKLAQQHRFALLCAYPIAGFNGNGLGDGIQDVCSCHSRVLPAESYATATTEEKRLRAITLLQQKAESLAAEIEHRSEVEKALSSRERELADFFENALEGLHKVGPDGTILWANKADYSLLGYSKDEYIGHPIAEFHADADVIADILQRLQNGESLVNFPARMRCKNGTIKHVQITSNVCFDEGEFAYTRCFTRDITREFQAEKALLETDRRKDEFLATLSHELRNPLAPICNSLDLLDRETCDESTRKEARSVIKRQVDQMTRLVDDLLDLSRVTRDKIELRKEIVDLASIIDSALETSRPAIDSAGHEWKVDLPEQPLRVEVDPSRIAQVFSNLLNNASKFTERGGIIEIKARQQGSEVVVSIRDNGIGIACEELAHVFDMFRQVDQSLEKSHGGLGIGLTLVRRLVELHGGTVNAQSEGPGKGSEFNVRLPAANSVEQKSQTQTAKNGKETAISNLRVLVVDDNHDSGHTLALLLKHKGHEVRTAGDGLEAITVAEEFRPDVILMDVGMPKVNGYEATRRLRETPFGKDIMIVALTGWGQASDIASSIEAGCSAHLVKPVDFTKLESLLATAKKSGA